MRFNLMLGLLALVITCGATQTAFAQWQNGNLAVRTNGNQFQSGEPLRVELLALEEIAEPFYAQVVYVYTEKVKEKDDEGKETEKTVERTRKRDAGPVINRFEQHQTLLLDDRFHFGDGSPAGWYEVRVCLMQPYSNRLLAVLKSCVYFQNAGSDQESEAYCGLFLRGLKRVNNELFWTFSGHFKETGRFSVILLRGGKPVRHLKGAGYASGEREFNLSSPELAGTSARTYDVLIHDHDTGLSTTAAKVAIPDAQ